MEDPADIPCILVSKKDQQAIEQNFYQNALGIGRQFFFVESMDDARSIWWATTAFSRLPIWARRPL